MFVTMLQRTALGPQESCMASAAGRLAATFVSATWAAVDPGPRRLASCLPGAQEHARATPLRPTQQRGLPAPGAAGTPCLDKQGAPAPGSPARTGRRRRLPGSSSASHPLPAPRSTGAQVEAPLSEIQEAPPREVARESSLSRKTMQPGRLERMPPLAWPTQPRSLPAQVQTETSERNLNP